MTRSVKTLTDPNQSGRSVDNFLMGSGTITGIAPQNNYITTLGLANSQTYCAANVNR